MNKSFAGLLAIVFTFATLGLTSFSAEAKRLGGGGSVGMQRSVSPAPAHQATPAKPATPAQQAAPGQANPAPAAAAQAGKRNWLGPIAGLAAGIGLAALLSHFGMGEQVANFLMIALLVMAVIFVVRLLLRKREAQPAMQYAGAGQSGRIEPMNFEAAKVDGGGTATAAGLANIPADFDSDGFLRQAKLNFLRLQAANDRGDMDDLKSFISPELFAEIQMQYQDRGRTTQQTDVVEFHASLLEVVTEQNQHIASVRFHGLLREEAGSAPAPFDEIWHLSKPVDGSFGWRVSGIQQMA